MTVKINLNEQRIVEKVTNDDFGLNVAREWKRLIDAFTPRNTGLLEENAELLPFAIHYKSIYAHYMYNGIVYVDPVTKVSGFLTKDGQWKSRYGITKIKSNRKFNYRKINPFATDHWDKKAAEAGKLQILYRIINTGLENGNF